MLIQIAEINNQWNTPQRTAYECHVERSSKKHLLWVKTFCFFLSQVYLWNPSWAECSPTKYQTGTNRPGAAYFMTPVTPQGVCVFLSDYNCIGWWIKSYDLKTSILESISNTIMLNNPSHSLSLCVSVMIQLLYITAKNTLTDCTESIVGTARHFSHLYSLAEFALGEF